MKPLTITKKRRLQSGKVVDQYSREITMTISSMCPEKWLFVDMETGNVWHVREYEIEHGQKNNYQFWRSATKTELKNLKKLRTT